MWIARLYFLFLLTCLCATDKASAQVAEEHHYLFTFSGLETGRDEKMLLGLLHGLDPHAVISLDRERHLMKLMAERPLDITEVIAVAGQVNVSLSPSTTSLGRLSSDLQSE
ncbi:MAG: hypothetical protein IPH53_19890 [Flavobacteriales bacterium]|nr:hypothetical protein [Flavobacteriales bacterium]